MIGLLSWSGLTDAQGNVQVSGTVTSQSGAGVGDVTVYASTPGTNNDISGTTTTDLNGNYVLSVPTGTYDFHFIPPSATGMSTQVESNITVSSNQTINVQYPVVNYIFSGTITDNTGHDLVASVELTDSQGNSATIQTSNGYFSISVEPGMYALSVDGKDTYVGGNNGFQFGIAQSNSSPSINMTNGDVTQNLQLNTAVMTTTAYNPQGYPDGGAILNAYALHGTTSLYPGDPGETISSVLDGNTTSLGTIVGATYGTALNPNTENGSICYENYPYTSNPVCLAAPLTVTGNMNVAVPQSPPPTNTFSGTVTDNEGHALNNVMVYLTDAYGNTVSASTNNSGVFSVYAEPGTYAVSVIGKDTYVGGNGGFMFSIAQSSSNPTINLNDGNITQNLQLDTATLNVTAYTSQGTPATNASAIYGDATSGTTSLYPGDPGETIKTSMGAGSGYTLNLGTVVGAVYAASSVTSTYAKSLCYENPPTYNFVCLNSPVTASGNMAVGIPQGSLTPSAPTNLTAPSPTDAAPALSWDSVSGATSYNIYQDGTLIGSSTTTSYTDTSTLTSGTTYSYYVTAVNSSGESSPSNTISVLYDTTSPTITYAVTPIADSNGYNTGNVLVTFMCSSPTPGVTITSCTSPVTEPDEGIGQIVAGSATDSAGNTSMINANASLLVSAISAGSTGSSPYAADTNYSGGQTYSSSASVDTSNVLNPAPQSVYQNCRYGNTFSYTFPDLTPGAAYTLRLDFNELYWGTALSSTGGIGSRVFNVAVNGTPALTNFDSYAAAGGSNKAIAEQIPTTADSNGNITVTFTAVTDNAMVSGLELFSGTLPNLAPIPPATSAYIAAGSTSRIGSFSSDNDYSGGTTYSTNATIDTSGVSNPAPQSVYQNDRYGTNFTYTIPNLVPNTNYSVRLDFAEPYWGANGNSGGAGSRLFNVTINGDQVLTNFDIYATAGGANKAVDENFTATSDSDGRITINFAAVTDNAMVSGIEVGEE